MAKTDDQGVRHPSARGIVAAAQLGVALLICGCQDPALAPKPLTVTSEPAATTSGGIITLTSEQFSGLTLVPGTDTLRPNRWTNFAVIVGSDTVESWRVAPTQIAFRVPPILTGNHQAVIVAQGHDRATVPFFGVGLAVPFYWGGLYAYTNVTSGTLLPGRGLLVAEGTGYGLIDVQDRRLRMYDELRAALPNRVKMTVPGPSYRANHFIFDASPLGTAAATVWRSDPWTLIDTIPCGDAGDLYTAVELSATTCLSLHFGRVVRNGTDTVVADFFAAREGEFRLAPGGNWAVIKTELSVRGLRDPAMSWPVFDRAGNVAYRIDTLFEVTGAAFSAGSDTLFVTASVHDTTGKNFAQGRFSIAALETATGRTLSARTFSSERALQDVALDPVRPLLYVAGVQAEQDGDFSRFRQYLTVLDRQTLSVIADMPAPWGQYFAGVGDATLVYQNGRVSVVGWCGFDCGGLWVYTYDLP